MGDNFICSVYSLRRRQAQHLGSGLHDALNKHLLSERKGMNCKYWEVGDGETGRVTIHLSQQGNRYKIKLNYVIDKSIRLQRLL